MDTLGLYLSIPFCRSKCTYCNFASGVFPASSFARYIDRVEQDLRAARLKAEEWGARLPEVVNTVYLGGGTPSLLPPELMLQWFAALRREFVVLPSAEITVECAPGQLEDATLAAMVECGVNRVSFGVQSFIDTEAKHSGRLHTREIALRDIERVRRAGVSDVNVDLIAGLAGQTQASWRESLGVLAQAMVSAGDGANHASVYMLEVDEDSRLGREVSSGGLKYYAPQVPSDDAIAEMYVEAVEFLEKLGVAQYEISNFARCGAESRHNRKYWERAPYLGLGLDAHSMLRSERGGAIRFATTDDLNSFLNAPGWDEARRLLSSEELEEAWFLGLRLNEGVNLGEMRRSFGAAAVNEFEAVLVDLECEELIEWTEERVKLTERGRLLSNEVFGRFLSRVAAV